MDSPITQIKNYCNGQWDNIISALTGFDGKPTHCPQHGGKTGKAFYGKKGKYRDTGMTWCNTCGCNSDGISTLSFITGESTSEVVKRLIDYMGGLEVDQDYLEKMKERQKADAKKRRFKSNLHFKKAINDIYELVKGSDFLEDAKQYFTKRGLKPIANCYYRDIRFVKAVTHYEDASQFTHDAVIGIMRNLDNKIRNVQRVFIDHDFSKATNCENPKKLMPSPKEGWHNGSAVWMRAKHNQMPGVIHVCEGFENGHAVISESPIPYIDMACCLTAGNLAQFEIPEGTTTLIIWADNDGFTTKKDGTVVNVGLDDARILKSRAIEMGINAIIMAPQQEGDWNDYTDRLHLAWDKLLSRLNAA